MEDGFIITLDGPAGAGKSTLARLLAQKRGLPFLDTGAMFRCIALHLGEAGPALDEESLRARLRELRFALEGEGYAAKLVCNGQVPGAEIRTEAVGALASRFAALPAVREFTKAGQQAIGAGHALVAEGRDTGTVIFPQARYKFFLEADPHIRALRRQQQLAEQGRKADLRELEAQILNRDQQDRQRELAPLKPAADAVIIDTSRLTLEQVLEKMLSYFPC
jgi:cytidylate kinase